MRRVLNFGSLNLDYVYNVDHFVSPGETLSAKSQNVNPGGKGLNQSCALARAGAKVFHAGCVGIGGDALIRVLRENGVDTSLLVHVEEQQGNAVIQVDSTGENCILLFGGSNQCIGDQQVIDTISQFSKGDILLLQNEINHLPLIVEKAYTQGLSIILNPSPYDERLDEVDFNKLSWLLVNEVEAEQISEAGDPEAAWTQIHRKYPELSVLITLGQKGSVAFQCCDGKVIKVKQESIPVRAIDTTAAGDTYTGYFVAALMEGKSLKDCMQLASIAAAISVTREGAAPSIPYRDEVEERLTHAVCRESLLTRQPRFFQN